MSFKLFYVSSFQLFFRQPLNMDFFSFSGSCFYFSLHMSLSKSKKTEQVKPWLFWVRFSCIIFVSHSADFTFITLRLNITSQQILRLFLFSPLYGCPDIVFIQTRYEAIYLLYKSVTYGKFTLVLFIVG